MTRRRPRLMLKRLMALMLLLLLLGLIGTGAVWRLTDARDRLRAHGLR